MRTCKFSAFITNFPPFKKYTLYFKSIQMVHYVLFWLKNPEDSEARKTMEEGLKKLVTIQTIQSSFLGTPAATEQRDVTDNSFTYSLMASFEDIAAHDSYQTDPIHHEFIDACKDLWQSVKVFDSSAL